MEKYYYNNNRGHSSKTLEITILSCEDLRINKRPINKNAFSTIRPAFSCETMTTAMDRDGGSYPRWDEKFSLEIPALTPSLTVEVHCKTAFGDRIIGSASVPATDFSGGYLPESYLHILSYRLRDSYGVRNGIVNISVRTKSPEQYTCRKETGKTISATMGVPEGNNKNGFLGGVVTGVPVMMSSLHDQRNYY